MTKWAKTAFHPVRLLLFAFLCATCIPTQAAEINLVSTIAMKPVLTELAPQFEQVTGNRLKMEFMSAVVLNRQLEGGTMFDVAILNAASIDGLIKRKKIDASTRKNIARSGMAVAVRSGTLRPDVNSTESFKRTLLSAKSIGYADPSFGGFSGFYIAGLFNRLGIASDVKPNVKLKANGHDLAEAIRGGDVTIGLMQTTEIASERGIEQVGMFPPGLQQYSVFAAGVSTKSEQVDASKALIEMLISPSVVLSLKNKGMTPASARM